MRELQTELERERSNTLYRGPTKIEHSIMAKLAVVQAKEETMERQRSRIAWLRDGDCNTDFFRRKHVLGIGLIESRF